jgi:hypothetical protein
LPPGTSQWNKIEYRLFSHIWMNWRGRPLESHEVIVNTVAATSTCTGLTVHAELNTRNYPKGIKITAQRMEGLERRALRRHDFHGECNYTLTPTLVGLPDRLGLGRRAVASFRMPEQTTRALGKLARSEQPHAS